ncbi:DUF4124 domain-containing protein [Marinobacter salsuginis]|uniref:DUF4124 domain-containing protein n=1 Tax=Marinobacter salsuginis TaxID=418719 RepID=UPI001D18819A|nr:DUF4124 domain-containing protein [Marinobacter salsuginis]
MAGLVLSFFLTSAVSAEVYTWIDSRGVAHFSDYPPGEIPHKQLDVQAPVTVPMSENLGQGKRVSGIRKEVEGLLASGRPTGSGATAKERPMPSWRRPAQPTEANWSGSSPSCGQAIATTGGTVSGSSAGRSARS